ncbi:hypothetical protein [Mycobacterium sp. EPa45]|uniref:hypothetical protein n=1 Tax=Mycobacterium sp. EPa45 TaxID=1545728 RepID=UPI000641C7C2|nr:hypothetical protein [Mycobacterium sp. EPa45]AKK27452.1 hypothetical protein AB431_13090 [Mycobacterium sp. EPa45]
MDLRWWPIALAGVLALAVCVVLAMVLPSARADRTLRPLAHVDRLTALPEYARIRRREAVLAVTTIALLVVLFLTAALSAARPSGSGREFDALHPEDVMLCVGAPVADGTTAQFLNHFARQATTYDAQRIGLTSPTVRVLPLTRDYQYAAQRLGEYGEPDAAQAAEFAKTVSYTDYAPSLRDTLALCMTGFGTEPTSHRRSLIYLGPSTFGPGDERSLFSGQQLADMADKAGIQVNAITRVDVSDAARRGDDELNALAQRSGGQFFRYHAAGPGGSDPTLTDDLDAIRANPAPVVLPGGARITAQLPDEPGPLLVTGLTVAALLGVALVVVRR